MTFFSRRYAEAGLYQAGNISSSSGASSGSHPASPLPHSLFTHEPLYQFYNAAKVEVSVMMCELIWRTPFEKWNGFWFGGNRSFSEQYLCQNIFASA